MAHRTKDGGWQLEEAFREEIADLWDSHEVTAIRMQCSRARFQDAMAEGDDNRAISERNLGADCIASHLSARKTLINRLQEIIGVGFPNGVIVNAADGIVYEQRGQQQASQLLVPGTPHL